MSEGMSGAPPSGAPLAIVCGAGSLPFAVAEAARRQGRGVVLFALRGWADPARVASYPHHWVRFGQLGRFCRTARREGCRDVVFIGSVVRPSLWQVWPDLATMRLMPQIIAMDLDGKLAPEKVMSYFTVENLVDLVVSRAAPVAS